MVTKHLAADNLESAYQINEEYLSASRNEFFRWYEHNPDLFVGVFDDKSLVGICYGMNWEKQAKCVILEGIATIHSYWRSGAGSLLIEFFEKQVRKRGMKRITLGSASDAKTENFYLKNGYKPTRLCAKLRAVDLPNDYLEMGFDFREVRQEGDEVILYVDAVVRDKHLQAKLRDRLGAREVIFIMDKDVT